MLLAAAVTSGSASAQAKRRLSDADLVRYAATRFDEAKMMFHTVVLGRHNGTIVVADFPCGDVCPGYTRRIIHYRAEPAQCARIGGVVVTESIPRGPAVWPVKYCEPRVLAARRKR